MSTFPTPAALTKTIKRLRQAVHESYARAQAMFEAIEPSVLAYTFSVTALDSGPQVDHAIRSLEEKIVRHNLIQNALCVQGLEPIMSPPHYKIRDFYAREEVRKLPSDPEARGPLLLEAIASFTEELDQTIADRRNEVKATLDTVGRTLSKLVRLFVARDPLDYASGFFACWELYNKTQSEKLRLLHTNWDGKAAAKKVLGKQIDFFEDRLEKRWKVVKAPDDRETFFQALSEHYNEMLELQEDFVNGGLRIGSRQRLLTEFFGEEESSEDEEE